MKIITQPIEVGKITDIKPGDTFMFEKGLGAVFMKLESSCLYQKHYDANAVSLVDGSFVFLYDHDEIIVVHGYFTHDKP